MKRLFIFLIMVFMLASCDSIDHIDDENGSDDYSLAQISDAEIIDSTSFLSYISIASSNNDGGNITVEKFSGVKKLTSLTKKDKIIVSFTVSEGNAALCLVTKAEIIHRFNINEDNQEYVIDTKEKLYLKLAGESAKVDIEYSIE